MMLGPGLGLKSSYDFQNRSSIDGNPPGGTGTCFS
jgi:hypothetical protein